MLTKEDFRTYLAQITELERTMIGVYSSLARDVEDPSLKPVFQRLMADEQKHEKYLVELQSL